MLVNIFIFGRNYPFKVHFNRTQSWLQPYLTAQFNAFFAHCVGSLVDCEHTGVDFTTQGGKCLALALVVKLVAC